ncbi:hypothetical protein CC78DRAFT_574819 [Lojkania enalia]|uniref:Uncharacterized protein n=1 Tax=Lojkania enalia TaxID=147567 RepID=A0A9P4TR28_9PLEO|nr:hypothetical protein CC78DRAFT_574819 [Didymosphaeria enalia]
MPIAHLQKCPLHYGGGGGGDDDGDDEGDLKAAEASRFTLLYIDRYIQGHLDSLGQKAPRSDSSPGISLTSRHPCPQPAAPASVAALAQKRHLLEALQDSHASTPDRAHCTLALAGAQARKARRRRPSTRRSSSTGRTPNDDDSPAASPACACLRFKCPPVSALARRARKPTKPLRAPGACVSAIPDYYHLSSPGVSVGRSVSQSVSQSVSPSKLVRSDQIRSRDRLLSPLPSCHTRRAIHRTATEQSRRKLPDALDENQQEEDSNCGH